MEVARGYLEYECVKVDHTAPLKPTPGLNGDFGGIAGDGGDVMAA